MSNLHALKAGVVIAGYDIIRVLGAGGFGITYEASSAITGKRVAIKEFFPRGIASRDSATRIVFDDKEGEVVAWALKRFESSTTDQCKLKHPNIVEVLHYVKDNGTGYMIMEYVEGQTLEHWLRSRTKPPTSDELRPLMEPVLGALEYLHKLRLIHRDIAPDNIMVTAGGKPMIIDFGALKVIEQQTQVRSNANRSFTVSKQFYSPPEQMDGDGELDRRADIYAVAATIYRAFAGKPPANAEERTQKLARKKGDSYVPMSEAAPSLREHIAGAIDQAMSFDADERQKSIGEFREAIGWSDVAAAQPTVAAPRPEEKKATPPAQPIFAWEERKSPLRWLLPVGSVAAVVAIVLLAFNPFGAKAPQTTVAVTQPIPPKPDLAPQPDPETIIRQAYEYAVQVNTRVAFENFLAAHPQSAHTQQARQHLRTIILQEQAILVSNIQTELERVGCGRNFVVGEWTPDTRDAARNFLQKINLPSVTSTEPTDGLLNVLRGTISRVCPLECPAGQHARDGVCVALPPPPAAKAVPQTQPQKAQIKDQQNQPVRDVQKKQPRLANPEAREDPSLKSGCATAHDRLQNTRC